MRVPVYEEQVGPQSAGLPVDSPTPASTAGLRAGLEGLAHGLDTVGARVQQAQEKAIAADVTDAETNFTKSVTAEIHGDSSAGTPGFMSLQGRAAEQDGAPVMERIEKRRQAIANGLSDERTKKLFLQRTGGQVESVRAGVETYVSQQRKVADVASLNARADAATEAMYAAARVGDGATVQQQSVALEGPIRALAVSPEDAAADVAKWQRRTVTTQLDAFLDVNRLDVAQKLLDDSKDMLGPDLTKKYDATLARAKSTGAAEVIAGELVSKSTSSIGEVNQTSVLAELNKLPPEVQAKVRPIAFQRMTEQEQAFAADTKRVSTSAFTLYNRVGWAAFSKSDVADELNQRDPALYNRLENDAQSEADRLERKRRGTAEDRRAQANLDAIALNAFMSMPPEERNDADPEVWAKGRGMSPVALSAIGKMKEAARAVVERGQATNEGEFVKRAVADAESTFDAGTSPQAKARRRMQVQDYEAKARRWFSGWVSEHDGHAPTDAEAADQSGKMALGRVPIGDEGAAQQAEVIVRRGTQKVRVLPELDLSGGAAPGLIRVRNKKTGATGRMPAGKFNPEMYERLDGP